jgi:hypothetical protein
VLSTLLIGGIALMALGVLMSTAWRKQGVTVSSIFWAGSNLAVHPERYVRGDRVSAVRAVNWAGAILWLSGVLLLLAQGVAQAL